MVEEYFGFSSAPFKLSPDARFFFGSKSHTKAMAYLHYGLRQAEGFIVITGEIGAGKSMLIGHMLEQLSDNNVLAAHLLTSQLAPEDLLPHILSSFQIESQSPGRASELEAFEDFLYDNVNRGRRVLLVVDEAQNLPLETIEELRMLTNINYQGTPLFQVFLVGQPEFRSVIARPDMEQLAQRIIATYHLEALDEMETREYIEHRLAVVGRVDKPAFTEEAFEAIYKFTQGVPRRINNLCTRILLFCALEQRDLINSVIVTNVAEELQKEVYRPALVSSVAEVDDLNVSAQNASDFAQQRDIQTNAIDMSVDQADNIKAKNTKTNNVTTLKDVATAIAKISKNQQPDDGGRVDDAIDYSQAVSPLVDASKPDAPLGDVEAQNRESEQRGDEKPLSLRNEGGQSESAHGESAQGESVQGESAQNEGAQEELPSSMMDHILSLRSDLRQAHSGNRDIYNAIADMEEKTADNIIQIERHITKADTIIDDLKDEYKV